MLRHIHISDAGVRKGGWEKPMGRLLNKKTVGIIGCGRIGKRLAQLLQPFECRVLGFDILKIKHKLIKGVSLTELYRQSDIISLHIPYTPEYHHMIDEKQLNLIKEGSFIVNASRGGLINEEALYRSLKNHKLGGAALDCYEEEPYQGPLKELGNVLLTSHIGTNAIEGRVLMEEQAVKNLIDALTEKGVIR